MAEMRAKMAQMEADGAFGDSSASASASATASASAPPRNAGASPPSTLTFHCMVSPDPTQDASPSSWQAMASATLGNVTVSSGDTVAALKGKVAELLRARGAAKGKGASAAWDVFDLVYNTKRLVVDEGAGGGKHAAVARVGDVLYRLEKESGRWPSPFAGTLWVARAAPKVASIFS